MKKKVISNATCNCMEQMILDLKYAASNAVDWMQYKTKIGKKKFLANNKKNIHKTECDRERQIKKNGRRTAKVRESEQNEKLVWEFWKLFIGGRMVVTGNDRLVKIDAALFTLSKINANNS